MGVRSRQADREQATEIADPLALRLRRALGHLLEVPAQLGEVYELVYAFVSGGGKMPVWGRWIKGKERGT
jgi:hypothetical protein